MPRKQRFKPSRKPKPNPQAEDAMTGQPVSRMTANDNIEDRATPQGRDDARDEDAPTASESDQR
jgi:hypothetical protein